MAGDALSALVGSRDGLYELGPGGSVEAVHLQGLEIAAVAEEAGTWWAIAGPSDLYRRLPGEGWALAARAGLPLRCLLALGSGLLAGSAGAHMLRLSPSGLEQSASFDEVSGRQSWYTPWGAPPDVRCMSSAGGSIYACVHVGGIPRSDDDGGSWTPTLEVDADAHDVAAPGGDLVLAATARGLAVSRDRGRSWSFHTQGLHAHYLRSVAVAGEQVLIGASEGPSGKRSAIYRAPLAGAMAFERCRAGLPEWFSSNLDTSCLAARGSAAFLATSGGELYRSGDAGGTWSKLPVRLPPVSCVLLVGD